MLRNNALVRALALLELPPRRVAGAVAAGVAAMGSALALAAIAAWLIARAWEMPPVLDLSVAVVSVRALGISRGVFRYLERLASHDTAFRGTTAARIVIYRRLANGDAAAVTGLRRGDLLTRTGDDVDTVGAVVVRAIVPMAVAAVLAVAAIGLLGTISLAAAGVLAVSLAVSGIVAPAMSARAARLAEREAMTATALFAEDAVTALDHAAELRVAGRLRGVLDAGRTESVGAAAAIDRAASGSAIAAAATPLAIGASVLGALLIGITLYGSDMTPMALAMLVLVPLAAFEAVSTLPAAAIALARAGHAAERIMALLDRAGTEELAGQALPADSTLRAVGIRAGWPESKATPVVDLDANPGARIAVIGASGSGKTTLLMTLAGLLEPIEGAVTLGGEPIRSLEAAGVRRQVTYFAEDAHLFDTSLLENLRVARGDLDATEAARVLGAVGLGEWLAGLPEGLDTVLTGGERAVSGGQRRRILLARALASPADVLLLDEPTEHLDATEGAALLRALLDRNSGLLEPHRSAVIVTHQLVADNCADQVLSLDFRGARKSVADLAKAT